MNEHRRRDFLKVSGSLLTTSWLASVWPDVLVAAESAAGAHLQNAGFAHIDAAQARNLAAAAERIFPGGDTPGAGDAGVIHFIDQALGSFLAGAADLLSEGSADLDARGKAIFATLPGERQDALLREVEATPFFGTLRFMTMVGLFAMPTYGGNRDHAGWRAIGFDHRHGWQAPFGHYDALAAKQAATKKERRDGH